MPDPTAHADDMKSLAVIEPNTSPAFWWVNPWGYALSMKRALDAVYLLSETTEDAYKAATTVIKQKDELVDYHRNNLNTFQRKVELTLKPACPHLYEDTIGYVQWAADKIKSLKASLDVITEDRNVYIEKLEKANAGRTLLVSRDKQIDGLFADIENEKQRVHAITRMVNDRDTMIDIRDKEIIRLTNLARNLRRKLSKAEKAAGIKPAKKKGAPRA
jgi:hypothetical protein